MASSDTTRPDGKPLRAVLIDVYQTLLSVGPAPSDAGRRWDALWTETLGSTPTLSLEDLAAATAGIIQRDHAAARAAGISFPEVFWPAVVRRAIPELDALPEAELDLFLFRQAQLVRTVTLSPGAAEVLRPLSAQNMRLGLISNAQPHSRRELDNALVAAGLTSSIFRPDFTFWSYLYGYAKPDPHIFRAVGARLLADGVTAEEILMVGDREDNDINPARDQGWRTWQLTPTPVAEPVEAGDWYQLAQRLGL